MKSVSFLKAYTLAIFQRAVEINKTQEILNELNDFNLIFKNDREIFSFFIDNEIKKEDKIYLIEKNFTDVFSKDVLKFISILAEENILESFDEIINIYKSLFEEKENKINIKIISPKKLDDIVIKDIAKKTEAITKKESKITTEIDTSLIAGIIVEIDDTIYDYSIKNKINSIYKKVTEKALSI